MIHTVKGFGIVKKTEVDVSLELSCFFDDLTDVVNLFSGFSAFSKSSLNIWKFTVHVLLKPGLEIFEHYFASLWDECNCTVVWVFFGAAFLWDWNENWPFPVLWQCWFSKFAGILSAALSQHHLSEFEIAQLEFHHLHQLFVLISHKAHLTSHSRCLALGEWAHHHDYLGHEDLFGVVLCIPATSS